MKEKENKLKFNGEYLNGNRWNGKYYNIDGNIEFEFGTLIYEGEYLYNMKNGKGKEYNYNGKLEFEGEYINGKINKEYYYNGKVKYEGEYLNI